MDYFAGNKEFFPGIGKIKFEGPDSRNPLAFKWYDENRIVSGKSMKEYLRFAVAYWHTFCGTGEDPFGPGTQIFPWDDPADLMDRNKARMDAAFEFITKMGIPFYCFHDTDVVGNGSVFEIEQRLVKMVDLAKERQNATGVKLLWGTANVFGNPRYMNGASTNPDFTVLTNAAVQVKNAIDATIALGGTGYVFWGGREGYMSLHNTDTKRELEHMGLFLSAARDYGRKQGFTGTFFVEPKPMEPTKHQYDYDVATVIGFLRKNGLDKDFKLNVEVNHATLAGHTFAHELRVPVCWARSMPTREITRTDGIPTSSPQTLPKLRKPCSKLSRQAVLPREGLISTPKQGAIPLILRISSSPIFRGWTFSPVDCSSRTGFCMNRTT
jgi:xylose isomerase